MINADIIVCYDYNFELCPKSCILAEPSLDYANERIKQDATTKVVVHTRLGCVCCPRWVAAPDDWRHEHELIRGKKKVLVPMPIFSRGTYGRAKITYMAEEDDE